MPCFHGWSQFEEDFSDKNLHQNPIWSGDTSDFKIQSGILNLNAPALTDTSCIFTNSNVGVEGIWELDVSMDFNPSTSNYVVIHLMLDQHNNGYFLKIGGSGDQVTLYQQSSQIEKTIIEGRRGLLNQTSNNIAIRVVRDSMQNWALYIDSARTGNYELHGTGQGDALLHSDYFGICCRYTSSRSDKSSFDNISVKGKIYTDSIPPSVRSYQLDENCHWQIKFSETLFNPEAHNFEIQDVENVITISEWTKGASEVRLTFSPKLQHGEIYNLILSALKDTAENLLLTDTLQAQCLYPEQFPIGSIRMSELMIDPEPPIGLPLTEFIELFNHSEFDIDLKHWFLADSKDTINLTGHIESDAFISLIEEKDRELWEKFENVVYVDKLPTLNNDQDELKIFTSKNHVVDSLSYDSKWYVEGRSVELINPNYVCSDTSNWQICLHPSGGTPGKPNAKWSDEVITNNVIFHIDTVSDQKASISFVPIPYSIGSSFKINPGIAVKRFEYESGQLSLEFERENDWQEFKLVLNELVTCWLDTMVLSIPFTIADSISNKNLIINEIMFDPGYNEEEYIELRNISERHLLLDHLQIEVFGSSGSLSIKQIDSSYCIMPSNGYMVLTENAAPLMDQFPRAHEDQLIEQDLPSLGNEEGSIVIRDQKGLMVDSIFYQSSFHSPLLINPKGVALERISKSNSSNMANNWHSASSTEGFGTPTYINSQASENAIHGDGLSIVPDIFSPDNDGYHDFTIIQVDLEKSGYFGDISIWNQYGVKVRDLARDVLFARTEQFIWNGLGDSGDKLPVGYYIVYVEAIHPHGERLKKRNTVVLAHSLK